MINKDKQDNNQKNDSKSINSFSGELVLPRKSRKGTRKQKRRR